MAVAAKILASDHILDRRLLASYILTQTQAHHHAVRTINRCRHLQPLLAIVDEQYRSYRGIDYGFPGTVHLLKAAGAGRIAAARVRTGSPPNRSSN
jgi:hypothetical protein